MGAPRLVDYEPAMARELVAMWRESFEDAVGIVDPHPVAEQLAYLERVVLPANTVKVLLDGGEIVGFVAASAETLAQLYVRRGRQRQGLGSRLLAWAQAQSGGRLRLHTFARNTRACAFYARSGFREVGRGFEPEWRLDDVCFEWRRDG